MNISLTFTSRQFVLNVISIKIIVPNTTVVAGIKNISFSWSIFMGIYSF
jgi:hypothetical protein